MKPVNKLILGVGQGLDSKAMIAFAVQWIFARWCSVDFCLVLLSGFGKRDCPSWQYPTRSCFGPGADDNLGPSMRIL